MIETETLLTTKLYVPRAHPNLVPRPRLGKLLAEGMDRKMTLISAPAGFGKTTLMSEWRLIHSDSGWPIGWVSLDEGDDDLPRFLSYLVAALQAIDEGAGEDALLMLRSPQPPPVETVMTAVVNDVAQIPRDFALVLDDYHVIMDEEIHRAVAFLLDHLPPQAHLVIASRADPPLPLARLRARGQLTEVRAADLRFTIEEAEAYLRGVMGLDLPEESVAALEEKTEGWIAGLQLAALSARGREDASRLAEAFTGSNRHVFGYLAEEVLDRQPEDVQRFLLQTSVLERLSASLCDAVTDRGDGQEMLERIEEANLFTVALDDDGHWYRYHHLFADALRRRLRQSNPELERELHLRASEWYEREGFANQAVRHALAAGDPERAALLVERHARTMLARSEMTALSGWIDALPTDLVCSRPRLCLAHGWTLLVNLKINELLSRVEEAERALTDRERSDEFSDDERNRLLGEATALRAYAAFYRSDPSRCVELCREALQLIPQEDLFVRSAAAFCMGQAQLMVGGVEEAENAFAEAADIARRTNNTLLSVFATANLGNIQRARGRLREAHENCLRALGLATGKGGRPLPVATVAHYWLGMLLYEFNDLEEAARHLGQCMELGRRGGAEGIALAGSLILAFVRLARGDEEGAHDLVWEAERQARGTDPSTVELVSAHLALLLLAREDLRGAIRWAEESGLSVEDDLNYQRELTYKAFARVLAARGKTQGALRLIERLLHTAEETGREDSTIKLLTLKAVTLLAHHDKRGALATLQSALALAEPEGYVRTFVDEGEPMAQLLSEVRLSLARDHGTTSRVSPEYVGKLLASLEQPPPKRTPSGVEPLTEPLSDRELEVVRLVAAGMKNAEIARELFVVVGTVKTHLNSAYRKLGVSSRTQAISRARDLELL